MFCLELMLYWGLTYEQFNEQPLALINRLFLLNQVRPFLPSTSWVQNGTIAASIYNVNMSKKGKPMSHEDIFPFLREERTVSEMYERDTQLELQAKVNSIFSSL